MEDEIKINNSSVLTIEFPSKMKLKYQLTNNNGKWEIDDIENVTNLTDSVMKTLSE